MTLPTDEEIEDFHARQRDLMHRCLDGIIDNPNVFLDKSSHQSTLFMLEIIPLIHELYFSEPVNVCKKVLDVGPQTFSGTGLLQRLHGPDTFCQLKMDVSAIDINDKFQKLGKIVAPDVRFIKGDIFQLDSAFDLIICSHVIEHVEEPLTFISRLRDLAHDYVIVACPWNETPIRTVGHVNTIDKVFVRKSGAKGQRIFTNFSWGKQREVSIFWYDGRLRR